MDVAVIYESLFGNTRAVADAITAGVRETAPGLLVAALPVAKATPDAVGAAGLIIVGGPTHLMRMSSRGSRRQGLQAAAKPDKQGRRHEPELDASGPGVREWLNAMPAALPGSTAAAFDTRLKYPLAGGASRPIERQLRRHGYQIAARAQGFVVDGTAGPLHAGELDRARAWGAALARQLAAAARS